MRWFLVLALTWRLDAAIINASTCSSSDVTTAISSASSGDTVAVPSGTCTWAADVTVATDNLTLQGQTTTSRDASTFIVTPTDHTTIKNHGFNVTSTLGVRITGFTFDQSSAGPGYVIGVPTAETNMRIDHNHFYFPSGWIWYKTGGNGNLNILLDHNLIEQPVEETIYFIGNGNQSWIDAGSCSAGDASKATIVEDNEMRLTTFSVAGPIDSGEGARWIVRYNLFSANTGFEYTELIESHGHCYGQLDGADNAAAYCESVYNNKVQKGTPNDDGNILAKFRGGRSYVYNNTISGANWADSAMVRYWIQETDGTNGCNATPCNVAQHQTMGLHNSPLPVNFVCTVYPCPMQPNNSYVWGNVMTSGIDTFGVDVEASNPATFMVSNRDYWFDGDTTFNSGTASAKPGTCSTNVNYWATDTTALYRCTSTNTWTLEYTQFQYPDPLQGGSSGGSSSGGHAVMGGAAVVH